MMSLEGRPASERGVLINVIYLKLEFFQAKVTEAFLFYT